MKPGDVLAEKYLVDKVLGQGGMGVVVAARHVDLDERVAIKFLLPDFATNTEVVARFLREGKAAVRIRSEHVARVIDVGRLANGSPYMVMEYLDGCDLSELVRERGPLPVAETALYVLQACEALAEAHAQGIVHRDLKPPNLFLTHRADRSPCVKVLDFGIAKFSSGDGAAASMTKTNGMMGSGLYMSPEQLRSAKDVDARTDIWSLGVVLFELLTGKPPFLAEDFGQLIAQILEAPPTALRSLRPDAPVELEAVIECCLEKRRDGRFTTVAGLAGALLPFAGPKGKVSVERISTILDVHLGAGAISERAAHGGVSESAPVQPTGGAVAATITDAAWGRTRNDEPTIPARRSKASLFAIAGAVVIVGIGTAAVLLRGDKEPGPSAANATEAASKETPKEDDPAAKTKVAAKSAKAADTEVPPPPPVQATTATATTAAPVVPTAPVTAAKPAKPAPDCAPGKANAAGQCDCPATHAGELVGGVAKCVAKPEKVKKPSVNCDPPTFVGPDGLEHYKPECK